MNNNLSRLNSCTWFSEQTKALASQLLSSLQIQQGVQLASLLGVDAILYNDEAVYVWVQRQPPLQVSQDPSIISHDL